MENADLKSQLKERDARIAKLESVLEESRRAGKRQAAPFSKDKPKRDPKKPGRKPGSKDRGRNYLGVALLEPRESPIFSVI